MTLTDWVITLTLVPCLALVILTARDAWSRK